MPVDHQSDEPIPMPMPIALERIEELADFGLCQVLPHPVSGVWFPDWSHNDICGLLGSMRWSLGNLAARWGSGHRLR
jgi:hypothetical protein